MNTSYPIEIDIFDIVFNHQINRTGDYSVVYNKTQPYIRYFHDNHNGQRLRIYTENNCMHVPFDLRTKKIGWLIETRSLHPKLYENIIDKKHCFAVIWTHDQKLIDSDPEKFKFVPFGGCWIDEKDCLIHNKSKVVSIIYSNKKSTEGHKYRHILAERYPEIPRYGRGTANPLDNKITAFKDYRFSLIVENVSERNYFTEKLIDCFATGTIPLYWGCPNISDFFDINGILAINHNNITNVLNNSEQIYKQLMPSVQKNFELCKEYWVNEKWLFDRVYYNV